MAHAFSTDLLDLLTQDTQLDFLFHPQIRHHHFLPPPPPHHFDADDPHLLPQQPHSSDLHLRSSRPDLRLSPFRRKEDARDDGDDDDAAGERQVQASNYNGGNELLADANKSYLHRQGDGEEDEEEEEEKEKEEEQTRNFSSPPPRKRRKIGRTRGNWSAGHGWIREEEGGGSLPQELVISNIVAARLPLVDLVRARMVCKAWKDAIFSPLLTVDFLSNRDCQRPWLIVEHRSPSGPSIAAYDLYHQAKNWFVIPTPSLFQNLIAVSNGLFCFAKRTEAGKVPCLVVGNPMTNQWKDLPEIPITEPIHGPQIAAMAADPSTGIYTVIILFGIWDSDATDAYLPFMYDSTACIWICRKTVPASLVFATSRSVLKHHTLLSIDHHALHLMSYNMNDSTCTTMNLRHLPPFMDCNDPKTNMWRRLPQITVCNSIVFLVARCCCSDNNVPDCQVGHMPIVRHGCLGIWEMNSENWEFITQVPLALLDELIRGSDGTDFIITSNRCNQIFFVLKGSPSMLVFDITSLSWTLLLGCPADYNSYPLHQSAFYESLLWIRTV